MAHVRAREPRACGTVATLLDRPRIAGIGRVLQVETTGGGQRGAGARRARRQHAVEHVDPARDHLEDPGGVADAHEVAGLRHRQELGAIRDRGEHLVPVLANCEASERVAVEAERDDLLDRTLAELAVGSALSDTEDELAWRALALALPGGPQRCAPHRLLELTAINARWRADVEAHRNVRAEIPLDRRHPLRGEPLGGAVVDRAERDALIVDCEQRVAQREDLETAGIGQDRAVPTGERVQPAELRDQLVARTEVQVVRVPEDHVGAERAYLVRMKRLHSPLRPDRHEGRRPDLTVSGSHDTGPRGAVGRLQLEATHRISIASPKE